MSRDELSAIVGRASPLGAPRGGRIFYVLYVQIYCVIKVPPPLEASHARRLVTTHFISISAVISHGFGLGVRILRLSDSAFLTFLTPRSKVRSKFGVK